MKLYMNINKKVKVVLLLLLSFLFTGCIDEQTNTVSNEDSPTPSSNYEVEKKGIESRLKLGSYYDRDDIDRYYIFSEGNKASFNVKGNNNYKRILYGTYSFKNDRLYIYYDTMEEYDNDDVQISDFNNECPDVFDVGDYLISNYYEPCGNEADLKTGTLVYIYKK